MALTQVVEHHLPTYVSLALAWQKGGSENLHEIRKNESASHCKNNKTHVIKYAASRFKKAAARGQLRGRKNPLQPILCFFFSKPLQGYQVDTTSVLQTTLKGWWWLSKKNNNPVGLFRPKKLILENNLHLS